MNYRFDHVGVWVRNAETVLEAYRNQLNNQLAGYWMAQGETENIFVGNGSDVTVHLQGAPVYPYQQPFIDRYGYTYEHLDLEVEDVDAAFEDLVAKGLKPLLPPQDMAHVRVGALEDRYGIVQELLGQSDLGLGKPDLSVPPGPTDLRLGQASIVVPDLSEAGDYYEQIFGWRRVYECTLDGGGYILLADPFYDAEHHNFLLKVWAPPNLPPREEGLLADRGPGIDSIVYYADDVDGAYQVVVRNGMQGVAEPRYDSTYGATIGWVKDPEGNDIAIMEAVPSDVILEALDSWKVSNFRNRNQPHLPACG